MNFYKHLDKILISTYDYNLTKANEAEAMDYKGNIFILNPGIAGESRIQFKVTSPSQLFMENESLKMLQKLPSTQPDWLQAAISEGRVFSLNTSYDNWEQNLKNKEPGKKVITISGMGDVGGMLTAGLRLCGGEVISKINIFDKDPNKIKRWELECNAILPGDNNCGFPAICGIEEEDLFNCHMFVFCVSIGVPEVGREAADVRMSQFKGNSKVIAYYARMARERGFNGIFAVVSDPVDLLCAEAYRESNKNSLGVLDYKGLRPDQIKGYGLGVMYARAAYYSKELKKDNMFLKEGRAFGPHGQGLIIADSIVNYCEADSEILTEKAMKSNLEVRAAGFKPYIAPALSSGALSIIATLKGEWHYSSNFIGGVFFGSRNRETNFGIEFEAYNFPGSLDFKLESTYAMLKEHGSDGGL